MPVIEVIKETPEATTLKIQATVFDPDRPYDLTGEYFVPETDFCDGLLKEKLAIYDHGLNELQNEFAAYAPPNPVLGVMKFLEKNDRGRWFELEIQRAHEYHDYVMELHRLGLLGASSRTLPNLKQVEKSGKITRWAEIEISVTPTPAESRTAYTAEEFAAVAGAFKSFAAPKLAKHDVTEPPVSNEPPVAPPAPEAEKTDLEKEVDRILADAPPIAPALPAEDDTVRLEVTALKEKNAELEARVAAQATQLAELEKSVKGLLETTIPGVEKSVTKATTFISQRMSDIFGQVKNWSNDQRVANDLPPLEAKFVPPAEPEGFRPPAPPRLASVFGDTAPGRR